MAVSRSNVCCRRIHTHRISPHELFVSSEVNHMKCFESKTNKPINRTKKTGIHILTAPQSPQLTYVTGTYDNHGDRRQVIKGQIVSKAHHLKVKHIKLVPHITPVGTDECGKFLTLPTKTPITYQRNRKKEISIVTCLFKDHSLNINSIEQLLIIVKCTQCTTLKPFHP